MPSLVDSPTTLAIRLLASAASGTGTLRVDNFQVRASLPTATITGAATAAAFTTTYGTASTAQTFSVSGANLTANLVATAPTGFEVSSDGTTYGSTATFTQTSGTASGTLSVRLAATAAVGGTYNAQNIVLSSTGATSVNITTAASGNTVSAKGLTITGVTAVSKVYTGTTAATLTGTASYSGLVNSESFTVTGTPTATFATANVGTGIAVTVTGYTAPSTNYTVTQPTGLTADITAAALSVTANNLTKAFGATLTSGPGSTAFSSVGLVNSETIGSVTITYGSGAAAGDPAGSYSGSIVPSDATGGTFTASNYTISYFAGDLTVSANPVINTTGTLTAVNTTYGSPSATPTSFTVAGSNLTADLSVTAPTGYEVSTSAGSGYGSSLTLTQSSGAVATTTIYVRLAATATVAGSPYTGNVAVATTGTSTVNVPVASSTVSPAALTITGVTADSKTYDGGTTATLSGTPTYAGLVNSESFAVTGTPTATFGSKGVGTAKTVTVTGYTAPSTNYTLTQPTLTADITAKALTVPDAAVTAKAYDGTTTATITGTLSGVISGDAVTFVPSGTFATAGAGTGIAVTSTSTITGADAGNYSFTQITGLTGTINQASQTITFNALPTKLTTDAPFALTATASSGLTVSYSSSNTAVATVSGSTVTIVGAGTTTITASQAGDTNYTAATSVDQTLAVVPPLAPGDIAIIAMQEDDADQFAFVALVDIAGSTQIAFTDNAWNGTTSALTTNEGTLTWTAPAGGVTKGTVVTYTTGVGFSTGTASSVVNVNLSTSGDQLLAYQGTAAAPAFIYALSSTTFITTGTPTTNNTFLPPGLVNGTSARDFATDVDNQYYTTVTNGGTKADFLAAIGTAANWTRNDTRFTTLPSWTFAFLTPQTITFGPLTAVTFGDAPFALTATASSGLTVTYTSSDTNVATISGSTVTIVGGGTTTITASQAGDSTYSAAPSVQQTLTVNKATQTLSGLATTATKTYGDAAYSLSASASSGLTVSYSSSNTSVATISGSTVTIVGAGTTTITASQAGNASYSAASSISQTLTVNQKGLTISGIAAASKTYDRTTVGSLSGTATLVGVVGSDDVSLAGSISVVFGQFTVGTAIPVSVSGYTLAGTKAGNYTLTQPTGFTADITPLALTVSGAAVTAKAYDGTTAATITGTLSGVISPDVVNFVGTGTFATASAGTGIAVTSTSTITGADAGNYTLTQPTGLTGDIIASSDANLTNLTISTGTLSPSFSSGTLSYATTVPLATTTITVTPTASDSGATIKINGTAVTSGTGLAVTVAPTTNTISVVVTAADLSTTKTYTITATVGGQGGVLQFVTTPIFVNPLTISGAPNTVVATIRRTVALGGAASVAVKLGTPVVTTPLVALTSPADFTFPAGGITVNFADGQATATVSIPLTSTVRNGRFLLTLSAPTGGFASGVSLGTVSSALVEVAKKDTSVPTLAVTFGAMDTNTGLVTVSGTASDPDTGLNRVELAVVNINNTGTPSALTLGTGGSFTRTVQLEHGLNTLTVTAYDGSGNKKALTSKYTFTDPDVTALVGSYNGLVVPSGTVSNDKAGYMTITVAAATSVSGKFTVGGATVPFSGVLDSAGAVHFKPAFETDLDVVDVADFEAYLGALSISLVPGQATGTLKTAPGGSTLAVATALKEATTVNANLLNAGASQKYTVVFPSKTQGGLTAAEFPQGDGYASVTVTATGAVTAVGMLADGTVYSAAGRLQTAGATQDVCLHANLYRKSGGFSTKLAFSLTPVTNGAYVTNSDSLWTRPALPRARYYKAGWPTGVYVDATGSKYSPTGTILPVANTTATNARLELESGVPPVTTTRDLNISATNMVTNKTTSDPAVKLTFVAGTGLFKGVFTNAGKVTAFQGAVLQEGTNSKGFGYFLTVPPRSYTLTGESGGVSLLLVP